MDSPTSLLALPVDLLKHVATELSTADVLCFGTICRDMVRRLDDVRTCGDVYRCFNAAVDDEGSVEPRALTALIGRIGSLPFGLRPALLRAVTLRAADLPDYQHGQAYHQFWSMRHRRSKCAMVFPDVSQQLAIGAWQQCVEDTNRHLYNDASRVVRETGLRDMLLAHVYAPLLKVETFIADWSGLITDVAAGLPLRYRLVVIDCLLTTHRSSDVPRVLADVNALFDSPRIWGAKGESPQTVSSDHAASLPTMPARLLFNLIDTLMASSPDIDLRTRFLQRLRIDARYLRDHVDPYVANWIAAQGMFLADVGASSTGSCFYPWSETLEQQLEKWHPDYDNAFCRHLHQGFLDVVVAQMSWGHVSGAAALPEAERQVLRDRVVSLSHEAVYALGTERDIVPAFWALYVQFEHDDMSLNALGAWTSIMRVTWQLQAVLVERWSRRLSIYAEDRNYARAYFGHADTVLHDCLQWERDLGIRCRQFGMPALAVRVMTASLWVQSAVARWRATANGAYREAGSDAVSASPFNPDFSEVGCAHLFALPGDTQMAFLAALHVTGAAADDAQWRPYLRVRLAGVLSDPRSRLFRPSAAVMSFLCERVPDLWDVVTDANDAERTRLDRLLDRLDLSPDMRVHFRRRLFETLAARVAAKALTMTQAVASVAAPGDGATRWALLSFIEKHARQ